MTAPSAPLSPRTSAGRAALALPEENRSLSPYTGFTRDHWEAAADSLLTHAWRWASPRGARLDLPGRSSRSGVRSDGLEGYARTFLAAAFRVAGAQGEDPHGWMERYAQGLVAGTEQPGADDAESWPQIRSYDVFGQPMVESASVALGLRVTRPWLWDRLGTAEQDRAESWLRGALTSVPAPNNWYLFPYTVAGFLESVGRGDELTSRIRERGLALLDSWYAGDGWYTDGDGGSYDHYNGWALHLYPVLDELLAAREAGADPRQSVSVWGERLHEHLGSFSHFFAADGAPVYFGRSMTYRFAAGAAVGLGAATGNTPLTPGASRRVLSGALTYFLDHGALNEHGLLSLGWHAEHEATLQPYSGPASPYWASKAFVALLAPADDPLWTSREEASPAESGDHAVAVPAPGLLLQSTQRDGVVRLHNHGADHLRDVDGEASASSDPLYDRWAYSTHTGPTAAHNQPDNDFAVIWRGVRGSRHRVRPLGVGAGSAGAGDARGEEWGWASSWHRPIFPGRASAVPGLTVQSVVVVKGAYELRIHVVSGAPDAASAEATGWAVADSKADDGGAAGTDGAVASALVPLAGWEHADEVTAPAGTAYAASARVPRLRAELQPGQERVLVSAAALAGGVNGGGVLDLEGIIEDLTVDSSTVSFRWAGDAETTRVQLDPLSVVKG